MAAKGTDTATALTAAVLLAALVLRWRLAAWGLPYDVHWDEPQTAGNALRMLADGDPHPHFLRYGTLLTYLCVPVDALVALVLFGRDQPPMLTHLSEATVHGWTFSHPAFLQANRMLVGAIGVLGIGAVAAHARVAGGAWAGAIAAAFLAFLPIDAEYSAQVTPNGPLAAFVACCAAATARYHRDGGGRWLLLAFAAAGAAASFKYTGGAVAMLPVTALALRRTPRDAWTALALPAAFLVGTPYAILDLPFFVNELGTEIRHYRVLGHPGATVEPGLPHLLRGLEGIGRSLGVWRALLLAIALPFALVARRTFAPGAWTIFAFPVLYAGFLTSWQVDFHRNWLPVYGFAAVATGVGLARVAAAMRGGPAAVAAVVAASSLGGVVALAPSRDDARHAMVEHIRTSGLRPAIPTELGLHPTDLARLPAGVEVASLRALVCGAPRDVVVPARFLSMANSDAVWRLDALLPGGPIAGAGLWLDGTSPALDLRIVRSDPPPPGCADVATLPLSTWIGSRDFPRDEHAIYLVWAGAVTTPPLALPPGRYVAAWRIRGMPAANVWPTWEATTSGASTGGAMATEWGEAALPFEVGDEPVALTLTFTNDAAEGGEDRNLEVHGLTVRRR